MVAAASVRLAGLQGVSALEATEERDWQEEWVQAAPVAQGVKRVGNLAWVSEVTQAVWRVVGQSCNWP
jgi:hypothetical protein